MVELDKVHIELVERIRSKDFVDIVPVQVLVVLHILAHRTVMHIGIGACELVFVHVQAYALLVFLQLL